MVTRFCLCLTAMVFVATAMGAENGVRPHDYVLSKTSAVVASRDANVGGTINGSGNVNGALELGKSFSIVIATPTPITGLDQFAVVISNAKSPYLFLAGRTAKGVQNPTFNFVVDVALVSALREFYSGSLVPDQHNRLTQAGALTDLKITIYGEHNKNGVNPDDGVDQLGETTLPGGFSVDAVSIGTALVTSPAFNASTGVFNSSVGVPIVFTIHLPILQADLTEPVVVLDSLDGSLTTPTRLVPGGGAWDTSISHVWTVPGTFQCKFTLTLEGVTKLFYLTVVIAPPPDIVDEKHFGSYHVVITIDPITMKVKSMTGAPSGATAQVKFAKSKVKGGLALFYGVVLKYK